MNASENNTKTAKHLIRLSLLTIAGSLLYVIIDLVRGTPALILTHAIPLFMALVSVYLNKKGKYNAAISFLHVGVTTAVYMYVSSGLEDGYILYLMVSIGTVAFYGPANKIFPYSLLTFTFILYYIGYFYPVQYVDLSVIPPWYNNVLVHINFILTSLVISIVVFYLIKANDTANLLLHKANEELLVFKNKLEIAIAVNKTGVWEYDINKKELFVSNNTIKLLGIFGIKDKKVALKTCLNAIHPEDLNNIKIQYQALIKEGKKFSFDIRLKTKEHKYYWYSQSGSLELDKNAQPKKLFGTITDIHIKKTSEKLVLQEKDNLQKEKSDLDHILHSTTHDIKGPLSNITGLIGISNESDDINEIKTYMKLMNEQVNHLGDFISDMTNMSYNANIKINMISLNVLDLTNSIVKNIKIAPEYASIKFEIDVPNDLFIDSDKLRLEMMLKNLLTNAAKYNDSSKESYVKISAKASSKEMIIIVSDNGIGIAKEKVSSVFDMFYRATNEKKGSGVGLFIAKEAALKLGGNITVVSTLGEGTIFSIMLPIK